MNKLKVLKALKSIQIISTIAAVSSAVAGTVMVVKAVRQYHEDATNPANNVLIAYSSDEDTKKVTEKLHKDARNVIAASVGTVAVSGIFALIAHKAYAKRLIISTTGLSRFQINQIVNYSFDFTNVDVSFKYEISVSADETSAVSDLVATGYIVDNGTRIDFTNFNELISDTISLNDNIQSRDIRVFVMWDDNSETQTMDNIADTTSTMVNNSNAILKVTISLTQIAN